MRLKVKISHVQQIVELIFDAKLEQGAIVCITGKNGVGKTTLVKAIRNLTNADTFARTSSEDVFNEKSTIEYQIDDQSLEYKYEESISTINCRTPIPLEYREKIFVELPIPYGERFTFFQRISGLDKDIRRAVAVGIYKKPTELIGFLQQIYQNSNFENLVAIEIKGAVYYCRIKEDGRYLREDYFSSGEYFLINLYRRVVRGYKLIAIDEVDISLDAAAQVRLIKKLRQFGLQNNVRFLLTTHSLAMMQTVEPNELFYLNFESETGIGKVENVSYNYIRSILFGFKGWDKYILTEDDVLKDLLEYLLQVYCNNLHFSYKIIYIGGGQNTVDLMQRNKSEEFLSAAENVICVLDGDQKKKRIAKNEHVYCIPFESLEKEFLACCLEGGFSAKFDYKKLDFGNIERLERYMPKFRNNGNHSTKKIMSIKIIFFKFLEKICWWRRGLKKPENLDVATESQFSEAGKRLLKSIIRNKIMSQQDVIQHLCKANESAIIEFSCKLQEFLTINPKKNIHASSVESAAEAMPPK